MASTAKETILALCYVASYTSYFDHRLTGYGKTVSHVVIGMKTVKGTKQLKLDPSIYESLQKEKVEVGDVIYIEANSGAVKVSDVMFIKRNRISLACSTAALFVGLIFIQTFNTL